jgi:2-dehydropantoate 2-reductase
MHLVVMGAGALGTLFGAAAWRAGARVTLIGRPEHARAIELRGVVLLDGHGGQVRFQGAGLVPVTEVASVEGDADYLLITVKSRGLAPAIEQLAPLKGRVRTVVSLQNGVEHDGLLAEAFGPERVIGGLTMEGAALPAPGVIEHLLASTTYLGELAGGRSDRVEALAGLFGCGGLETRVVDDIETAKWTKFVQSCAASSVCGLTRLGYAPATSTEPGARLYVRLVKEGAAVMRAAGLEPGDYFTDAARVRDVSRLPEDEAVALVRGIARAMISRGYTGATSLARDLADGRPSEADALMGAMCRAADSRGLSVPTMHAAHLAIGAVDESRTP